MDKEQVQALDKVRCDLVECIDKTVRVYSRFQKELLKANHSNRIRKVSTTIEEIPHWCNTLRDLVQEQITVILNQPSASEKKEKEAEERRKKKIHEDCVCYSCIFN